MKAREPRASLHDDKKATEHLANERTFLAWVRTSIAIVSLGFVVAKFDVWMRELAGSSATTPSHAGNPHASLVIGIVMMAIGGIFVALAARRYHRVTLDIERGEVRADRGLVLFVTAVVVVLSLAMIGCMIFSADRMYRKNVQTPGSGRPLNRLR
jgi:putative membrane protein